MKLREQVSILGGTTFRFTSPAPLIVPSSEGRLAASLSALQEQKPISESISSISDIQKIINKTVDNSLENSLERGSFSYRLMKHQDGSGETKGSYNIDILGIKKWNKFTDIGVFRLSTESGISASNLNYKISELPKCQSKMSLGYPVVIIGYPAFGIKYVDLYNQGFKQYVSYRIISNGIISGHDASVVIPQGSLPYPNYFVSAKIDSGNSGGVAFSKDEKGLCVLGVPTWLTVGNYETQGLVQNIHNVMYVR